MTNEKIIEEIWHLVYEYKINEKVESTLKELKNKNPNMSYLDRLTKSYNLHKPKERDLLKLCGEYDEYYCEFKGGKWIWLENFNYIEKEEGTFKSKKRGYIEGKQSELMRVLEEYETITKISLYDDNEFGVHIPKNEFEEKLYYSKKMNQKEIIVMIQEEIQRLKS